MQCPAWLLATVVLCFHSPYVDGHCSDLSNCMGFTSYEQILQCIRQCGSKQDVSNYGTVASSEQQNNEEEVEEQSLSLGLLLSALAPGSTEAQIFTGEPSHSEERRSYSMEHFRWGKPIGRKRRPIKLFNNNAIEEEPEESTETFRVERGQGAVLDIQQRNNVKTNGKYRMTHFRWNAPPDKRYSGFMRPYTEQSHTPLLSLIRNVIVKDGQQFKN
ncbi:proopiomelanocortin b [Myxocyprinus asiaticus]|uniref:proopiomelanocortin b n=1 Tax=Myxocyprinus asiaticus TaxID=70543 RepID=UPI0022227E3B|nr:proopiomelanocortin b [Myxocyprinus asiaticus]